MNWWPSKYLWKRSVRSSLSPLQFFCVRVTISINLNTTVGSVAYNILLLPACKLKILVTPAWWQGIGVTAKAMPQPSSYTWYNITLPGQANQKHTKNYSNAISVTGHSLTRHTFSPEQTIEKLLWWKSELTLCLPWYVICRAKGRQTIWCLIPWRTVSGNLFEVGKECEFLIFLCFVFRVKHRVWYH